MAHVLCWVQTPCLASVKLIKVFSVGDGFDFERLKPYEAHVDYFLFDTKGKLPGGNGVVFNWEILKEKTSPFLVTSPTLGWRFRIYFV